MRACIALHKNRDKDNTPMGANRDYLFLGLSDDELENVSMSTLPEIQMTGTSFNIILARESDINRIISAFGMTTH